MSFDVTTEEGMRDVQNLVKFLLENSDNDRYCYNDIHISYDSQFAKVEWATVLKSGEDDSYWVFKDWDKLLVTQVDFPDGSYEFAIDKDHEKELWDKWQAAHPEWYQDYRGWHNKMDEYEDDTSGILKGLNETCAVTVRPIEEPDVEAEWKKTQEQISHMFEEEYKRATEEMATIAEEHPTEESKRTMAETMIIETVPASDVADWEPVEDGDNPDLDEIFDDEEKEKLKDEKERQQSCWKDEADRYGTPNGGH